MGRQSIEPHVPLMTCAYRCLAFTICVAFVLHADSSSAQDRLLGSDGNKAKLYIEKNYSCANAVSIRIEAASAGYFDQSPDILQKKVAGTASAILGFECARVSEVSLKGYTNGVLVFEAKATKSRRWSIQTEPAPLESIALLMSLREPSFLALGALQAQLKPYENVDGIFSTYQFDAYEKQIHRFLTVVDGDLEAFRDYLIDPKEFGSFEAALTHYEDILALIRAYDQEQYPAYQQAFDDVAATLKDEYWSGRIAAVIDEQTTVAASVAAITDLASSGRSDFSNYMDRYLADWITGEAEFYLSDIDNAPLYEIQWASEFLEGYPDGKTTLKATSTALEESGNALSRAIPQRLEQLSVEAKNVVEASGSSHEDISTVLETGFALAGEFQDAGFSAHSEFVLTATITHIEDLLSKDIERFRTELEETSLDSDAGAILQQQASLYDELSGQFPGFSPYRDAIYSFLDSQKGSICLQILVDAGAWSQDAEKSIILDGEPKKLANLACDLYENGHTISDFHWDWWAPKTYRLTITEESGQEASFELSGDSFLFANTLMVNKKLGEQEGEVPADSYIARLILPPPTGAPDANGIRECDRLAADPFDNDKRASGVDFGRENFGEDDSDLKNFDRAIDACIAAVENAPNDVLQIYQLGRLLWYADDLERASEYLTTAVEAGHAPSMYYQAQTMFGSSDEYNVFVDAMLLLESSAKAGYSRSEQLSKELNPDGQKFYKLIPSPTEADILSTYETREESVTFPGIYHSNVKITGIKIRECFQTSATDFLCEYKPILECRMEIPGSGFLGTFFNSMAKAECAAAPDSFETMRKLPAGKWRRTPVKS